MKRLIILPLLLLTLSLGATRVYVATTGNDGTGDGTSGNPYLTIATGISHASAGDTVFVVAGSYTISTQVAVPVQISIYTNEAVTLTAGATLNPMFLLSSATENTNGNQSISGFTFDGNNLTGVKAIGIVARSNVKVNGNTFSNFLDAAVSFSGATTFDNKPTLFASGCEFRNNIVNNCANYTTYGTGALWHNGTAGMVISGNTITQTSRGSGDNGYPIKGRYNKGQLIYGNTLARKVDNQPYHFTVEYWDGEGGTQFYGNTCIGGALDIAGYYSVKGSYAYSYDVYQNVFKFSLADTLNNVDYPTWGVIVEGGAEDVIVRQNYFHNWNYPIGISVLQPATVMDRVLFAYNVVHNWGNSADAHGAAVLVGADGDDGEMHNIYFYNNTFYDDGVSFDPPYVVWFNATGGVFEDWRFINNIFQGGASFFFRTQANSGTPEFDTLLIRYNIQYGNGYSNEPYYDASFTPSNITYDNAIKSNPLFKSNETFRLRPTSTAIDAGLDVNLIKDYWGHRVGNSPDIGACETGDYVLFYGGKQL